MPPASFVKASLDGVTEAAASAKSMPADFRVSITNAPGKTAYPISSFTWLLIPAQSKDANKGTDPHRFSELDGHRRAEDDHTTEPTRRCRTVWWRR